MFNKIHGILTGHSGDSIYIQTGGIEWDIIVPSRCLALFGPVGEETQAFTWLHHYEDGMRLFGFPSQNERELFIDLMKVEGIGPRQALKILSGIAPAELTEALEAGNVKALQTISGVGPKLAQKMVLALKGTLVEMGDESGSATVASTPWADVVASLADMGFDRKAVVASVRSHASAVKEGQDGEKDLFRLVLMDLAAGGSSGGGSPR
ncbi:MAG: Holliday junction branch migration protein RuvA [Spirochaetaceae bacterium]|nr:Holliday junction branch migration protein RuvA [Spirochaetaceae bacterium]